MSLFDISRFVAAQGMQCFQGESCLWVEKKKFFFESVPGHRRIRLLPGEATRLFKHGAIAIRYTCSEEEGIRSFEYVCDDENFGLEALAPDARRRVRRGLESCEVRPVSFETLAREGSVINRSVFARQGRVRRSVMTDDARWARYMTICSELTSMEAYGAFIDGRIVGFSIAVYLDEYCYLFHTHAFSDYMKFNPIYALTYTVMRNALQKPEIKYVSQGLESFLVLPEVERFKLAMGFRKRPLGRRVEVSPWARPIFSTPASWVVGKLLRQFRPGLWEDFSAFSEALRAGRAG
jgi:hypothetical protein